MPVSRRDVVKGLLAATAAAPALATGKPATAPVRVDDPRVGPPTKGATEEQYRAEFAASYGDGEEHGYAYHCVNCQGNCAWEVWSKDGVITRESQSAQYPQLAPDVPDANPRGCNKGAQHSHMLRAKDRLLYPMKRVGARGAGRWQRISWDEAITMVASGLYDTLRTTGPAGNYVHAGAGLLTEARAASIKRLGTLLGAVRPYIASYVGDMFPGVSVVYGEGNIGCTWDFVYGADVNVFWGCNPNTSRIPDAHYLWEGKYRGSKIIVIAPEFNSTAIHADLWVPVKAGADGHLALAVLHRIIESKRYDATFLRTFTDLPLLVRSDTHELLRLHDVDTGDPRFDAASVARFASDHEKHHEVFVAFDTKKKKLTALPGCEGSSVPTLRLNDVDWDVAPALDGRYRVKLKGGAEVELEPAFAHLQRSLAEFSADKTRDVTGVHPRLVDTLARELTAAKVALITLGFSIGKHFNGMLSQRAIASLAAFVGKLGPFGGLNTENEWNITGLQGLSGFEGRYTHRFASGAVSEFMLGDGFDDFAKAFSDDDVRRATGRSQADYGKQVALEVAASKGDAGEKRGKPWWDQCETFLVFADARFRRNKGSYREAFLKKAKLIAYGDTRMSDFAVYADVLLPCTAPYESWDLRTNPGYHRYANLALPPARWQRVGEVKSEWEIATLVAEKLQALAVTRHARTKDERDLKIPDVTHTKDGVHDLTKLVAEFTAGGTLRTDKDAVEYALEHVDQFKPNHPASMVERGGFLVLNDKAGKSSPLYADKPYNSFESQLFLHQRFDTVSGRLTFYVDHARFLEAGAATPVATPSLTQGRFPLLLLTPHARWSIHSTYKTSTLLQRLQRGKPYVMINPSTAAARGIKDGDDVRMHNALGDVVLMAKLVAGVPPDAVVMEHGWEPFMFAGKQGHNALNADMLNLLEVADGWGHLKFGTNWDGNQHAYQATVELTPIARGKGGAR